MQRGDVVVGALAGDYGKPRPAVIVQTDAIGMKHPSVVVCQMASVLVDSPDLRVTIEADTRNGVSARSQVMADKPVTIRRERIGRMTGRLERAEMLRLIRSLAFVMGLAD